MGLFKNRYEKELDEALKHVEVNMSNNYKDAAQSDFKKYSDLYKRFIEEGRLKDRSKAYYENKYEEYKDKLQGYTHKDQKPYWT